MRHQTRMMLTSALLFTLVSCSSKDPIGNLGGGASAGLPSSAGGSLGSSGGSSGSSASSPSGGNCELPDESGGAGGASVTGTFGSSLTGTWTGQVTGYKFTSGSADVRLVITGGDPPGYVVFGAGAAPPPATDGDIGYPPDMPVPQGPGSGPAYWIEEGFHYDVLWASVTAQTVQLYVATHELWQDWCPLQTSYSEAPMPSCGCVPNYGSAFNLESNDCSLQRLDGTQIPVDCKKLELCRLGMPFEPCSCTASGCHAKLDLDVSFELSRGTGFLAGTLQAPFGKGPISLSKSKL